MAAVCAFLSNHLTDVLTFAGLVVGLFTLYYSRIAARNSQLSKRITDSGVPVISDLCARQRNNFVAVSFYINPGDYTITVTDIRVTGHRVAKAVKENDIPSGSQSHLWDCPPDEAFMDSLPCDIWLKPTSSRHEVLLCLPGYVTGEIEVVCALANGLPDIRRVTHVGE